MKRKTLGVCVILSTSLGLLALGCAPQTAADKPSEKDSADGSEVAMAWSPDADCSMCHSSEMDSTGNQACAASVHAAANVQCGVCHADADALTKVHEKADPAKSDKARLKKTSVSSDTCISCHGDLADIARETADSATVVDSDGNERNPHELSYEGEHQRYLCSTCHIQHQETPTPSSDSIEYCYECHHAEVFECGTCHS